MYNECMEITNTTPEPVFHELTRVQHNIKFQQFYILDKKPVPYRYRVSIVRNSYEDQSYGKAELFMLGLGWSEILRVGLDYLPEVETISYVQLPVDRDNPYYEEKYEKILHKMKIDAEKILTTVLQIMK
jgi:hypothetical protein